MVDVKNIEKMNKGSDSLATRDEGSSKVHRCMPYVDVLERDDAVVIMADMPGVSQEAVDVNLDRNVLMITAEAGQANIDKHERVYSEYGARRYERSFTLSEEIDRDKIEATMKLGVLHLTLPKAEQVRPRKIEVSGDS